MNARMPIVFIFKVGTLGEIMFALAPKNEEDNN